MRAAPHQHSIAQSPLVPFATSLAVGILLATIVTTPLIPILVLAASASVAAPLLLMNHRLLLATTSVTVALLLIGAALATIEKQNAPADSVRRMLTEGTLQSGETIELTGVVETAPEYAPNNIFLDLRVEMINFKGAAKKASGLIALSIPFNTATSTQCEILELRHGARLRVMTTLERTDNFRNPGVPTFTEYLDRRGYAATSFVKSPLLIERLDDDRVFLPLAWLYEWRRKMQREIHEKFSYETASVLDASLLGNRHSLSRPTAARFREGGTFHVLVISGLHISFIGGVVLLLVRRCTRNKKIQFFFSASVLWSYTLAVGAEASVARAAFMFTFVAFAPLVSRRAASLNALAAAAMILLVWRPGTLFDPSFQLTFVSVAAIVALAWPLLAQMLAIGSWHPTRETPTPPNAPSWLREISEVLFWSEREWQRDLQQSNHSYRLFKSPLASRLERYHLQPMLRYMFAAMVVSMSVQLTLLPLLVIYFHRLSLASVLLNIGVSALMAALSIIALAAMLLAQVSLTLAAPFIHLANGLNWLMVHSVDPFAAANLASIRVPEYSGAFACVYGLYYLPLLVIAGFLSGWNPLLSTQSRGNGRRYLRRSAVAVQLIALLLIIVHPFSATRPDGTLRVDFLDVGQGDSAIVTMPDGVTLLIDGGGRPDFSSRSPSEDDEDHFERDARSIGESVVSEYLWNRGLESVDYVVATHADADHIQGLNDIFRNFYVRAALVGRAPSADAEFSEFERTTDQQRVPIILIGAGDSLRFAGVGANIVWPPSNANRDAPSSNNDSVVLRLEFGSRSILFTGDIESPAEKLLVRGGNDLHSDVVKVAHHGSQSSSTEGFVDGVKAKWAVISVGQKSIFGHPHVEVVERWKASGAKVLTTGSSGTITIKTDGSEVWIKEFIPDYTDSKGVNKTIH